MTRGRNFGLVAILLNSVSALRIGGYSYPRRIVYIGKIVNCLHVFVISCAIGLLLWILPLFFPGKSGRVIETWESARGDQRIVVTAFAEKNRIVPVAYYSFEAIRGEARRDIMTFRHGDPVPTNKHGAVFLNAEIACVFMGWEYAVTTDGGSSWHLWSADKDLRGWQCCNYGLIKGVRLNADGTGTMILNPHPQLAAKVPELYTRDYGRHWTAE